MVFLKAHFKNYCILFVAALLIKFFMLHTVPLKSKLPVSSRFSRDESLVSRDESLVSRDERLVSRDESLVSRESLKRQFWNKLQANCLARSRLQSCAKVMRTNFALFSLKYRRTFDRYFAAFVRQLNEISATVRQGKRKIEPQIAYSNFRSREISKKIYIKSNEMSVNFPTPDKHELTRQNVNNHFNRV